MSTIKKLSTIEAQKIAAGEVVERPANVIKELIENSIDAQATTIHITIQDAGKEYIKIVDNGYGMNDSDAQLCLEHHATSKITCVDELSHISSFGFRGEALASIAAVSDIILQTKDESSLHGIFIHQQGGTFITTKEIAHPVGTSIEIKNLFFNTPARKKFLKTTATEQRAIIQIFHAFCLDYQHIYFSLTIDKHESYSCPPVKSLQDRIAQLWQKYESEKMMSLIEKQHSYISIHGIISDHQLYRYDKNHIYVFVNNRLVKNTSLIKACIKGYSHILPQDRFPAVVLKIIISPDQIDINVHPRKTEIQFLHPRKVEEAITQAIKYTLESAMSKKLPKQESFSPHHAISYTKHVITPDPKPIFFHDPKIMTNSISPQEYQIDMHTQHFTHQISHQSIEPTMLELSNCYALAQLHITYILAQTKEGLILIDQHAAHERIMYENLKKNFKSLATVPLIFPETITLTHNEIEVVLHHIDLFNDHGLIFEQINPNTIIVKNTPIFIKHCSMKDMVISILQYIMEERIEKIGQTITEKIHAQMACKSAIKAGDELTMEHMNKLLIDLSTSENRITCPHGRPTFWHISLHELERKFKRKT